MAMKLCIEILIVLSVVESQSYVFGSSDQSNRDQRAVTERPEIAKGLSQLELGENEKLVFVCALRKGTSPIEFSWTKDGITLNHDNVRVKKIEDMSVITIDKLMATDAGNYTCKARNSAGHDETTLQLRVKQTPKWIKEPEDKISAIGKELFLECSASGSPAPAISWFKLDDHSKQEIAQGNQLKIRAVTRQDVGMYECVAANGVDEPLRKSFRLAVNDSRLSSSPRHSKRAIVAPEIMKQVTSLKLQEDSKFTLLCSLNKGSSPVEFSWLKDGVPLIQKHIKIKTDQDILTSTLIIQKLKSSDAGNYTCQAQNSAGRDSHALSLIVKQTPKWLNEPLDVVTAIGRDVSVECSASGSPTPLITWFKLDQPKRKLLDTNSLRLYQITREAAGLYECVADNGVDEALRKTISILVNGRELLFLAQEGSVSEAPEILKQSSVSYKLKEDAKFSPMCSLSTGTNPITFTWLKDNKPILESHVKIVHLEALAATSLIIERLKSSDAGNYTCLAKNSAGQDSHTLQLAIKQIPKWLTEPQDVVTSIGQDVSVECSVIGSPSPVVTWFRLTQSNQRLHKGNYLRLTAVSSDDAGLYECIAENGVDEVLRKTVKVSVNVLGMKLAPLCV
ncbi:Hemicentin-2 [Halotydeus destructor]|nr:Hemicentin-2 [Halotydeus destructor]